MPAYVVAMMTVDDPATYGKYTDRTPAIIKKHGGRFLTRGGPVSCLEGQDYKGRMVMLEFPSRSNIDDWFNDPEYRQAVEFRHAASTIHYLMVQDGGDTTEAPEPNL